MAAAALGITFLCAFAWGADKAPSPALDLPTLLRAFAQSPGLSARFTERKHMALLAEPLESAGHLYFTPPGLLARHTVTPEPAVLLIEPKQIRMFDGTRWETLDLGGKPVVRLFVESFVRILQGDAAALERLYVLDFKADVQNRAAWTLVLRPKVAPMDKFIDRLELHGQRVVLDRMRIVEKGGDETVTQFHDVDPARRFTPAEKARFFFQQAR